MSGRVYLDWNATAPLRPEARDAMLAAMDVVGNPSSVHGEGRAARAIVERARDQVARLVGCEPSELVFTSGATEACARAIGHGRWTRVLATIVEHDAVTGAVEALPHGAVASSIMVAAGALWASAGAADAPSLAELPRTFTELAALHSAPKREAADGAGSGALAKILPGFTDDPTALLVLSAASGETGILGAMAPPKGAQRVFRDVTQLVGREAQPAGSGTDLAALSAHKIGGPKGAGALVVRDGLDLADPLRGGGQEQGRRSGTENVIGIAGFGAAAEAARRDLEDGVWERGRKT